MISYDPAVAHAEIARLQGEVDRLTAQLDAARGIASEMRDHQINDQIPCAWCAERLAAYDLAVGGGTSG